MKERKDDICRCGDYRSDHDKYGCRVHNCGEDVFGNKCQKFEKLKVTAARSV